MDKPLFNEMSLMQRQFVIEALRVAYPSNTVNSVIPWCKTSATGYSGVINEADASRNGLWGWHTFALPDPGCIAYCTTIDDEGNNVELRFRGGSNQGNSNFTVFALFHNITLQGEFGEQQPAWTFVGWKTDEEIYRETVLNGYQLVISIEMELTPLSAPATIGTNSGTAPLSITATTTKSSTVILQYSINQWYMLYTLPQLSTGLIPGQILIDYDINTDLPYAIGSDAISGINWELPVLFNPVTSDGYFQVLPKCYIFAQVGGGGKGVQQLTPIANCVAAEDPQDVRCLPGITEGISFSLVLVRNGLSVVFTDDYTTSYTNLGGALSLTPVVAGGTWVVTIVGDVQSLTQTTSVNFTKLF